MSCIVGIAENGKVWIGGDSAGIGPDGELQLRKEPKVFKIGDLLIGACGSPADYQGWVIPNTIFDPSMAAFDWVCFTFLPWLRTIRSADADFELLIGLRGHLFHVYGTRQVTEELAGFDAAGSGAQVARGALYFFEWDKTPTGQLKWHPTQRIELALEAAQRFTSTVREPWVILESE